MPFEIMWKNIVEPDGPHITIRRTSDVICRADNQGQNTLTYSLTPWSRVLLEKLASLQLVNKFPAFYGTRRFLTALTSARHLSLS